ncbi:MAG: hypothetical protein AABY22_07340 [Nanoarchaeota archaeon]
MKKTEKQYSCKSSSNISDSDLEKYINLQFTEEIIRRYEDQILEVMKLRQEKFASEKNNKEWLSFTNFVYSRRFQHIPTIETE